MSTPTVTIENGRARVVFDRFDLDAYRLFLRCKKLPERELRLLDRHRGVYAIETAERYAAFLDESLPRAAGVPSPLAAHLFQYQRFIVERALEARRFAVWADTGLGKTATFLEWARQVVAETGGRVLILSPLAIIGQTLDEHRHFYGETLFGACASDEPIEVEQLHTREALAAWCSGPGPGLAICNYEKLIAGVLPELRRLAGLVLDESSILKTGGGVVKWNLIKSARGIEYKLSCTATPAPNDTMEFASQAAFLEKLRNEGEILWTYFSRDKRGTWSVKPHARDAFFAFMASWSIYLRDPARLGFEDILASLPPSETHEYELAMTPEQAALAQELAAERSGGLPGTERLGVRERSKLQQLARGFLYGAGQSVDRTVASAKPAFVADLVAQDAPESPVLVWTTFDEEARIVEALIRKRGLDVTALHGATPKGERIPILQAFRRGELPVLVTKAQMAGYGMNFQACRSMVFSGFDDSYERMYQAVRRCYRFGQTKTVRVHVPYVPELEGVVFENLAEKQRRFNEAADEMESAYVAALGMKREAE